MIKPRNLFTNKNFSDAPAEIPKYKSEDSEVRPENSNNVGNSSSNQDIDKLKVILFSNSWGENSSKMGKIREDGMPGKLERQTRDIVNYSTGDSSEVEMLDSSTAHIENN